MAPRHHETQFVKPHAKSQGSARKPHRNTSCNDVGGRQDGFEQKSKGNKALDLSSAERGNFSFLREFLRLRRYRRHFSISASLRCVLRSRQPELPDSEFCPLLSVVCPARSVRSPDDLLLLPCYALKKLRKLWRFQIMNWQAPLCLGAFGRSSLLVLTFLIISPRLFALTSKITDTPYFLQEGFGPTGQLLPGDGTMYCGPTSMSDNMVWLARNGFPQLVPAVDQDNRTQSENANLVLSLAGLFGTTPASGTLNVNVVAGLIEYMRLKGFAATDFTCTGYPIPIPTLNYLLSANQGLSAVLLTIQWYDANFDFAGGHFIALLAADTATSA